MRSRVLLVLTVLVYLIDGHAPRMRELRNVDAEAGSARGASLAKRT